MVRVTGYVPVRACSPRRCRSPPSCTCCKIATQQRTRGGQFGCFVCSPSHPPSRTCDATLCGPSACVVGLTKSRTTHHHPPNNTPLTSPPGGPDEIKETQHHRVNNTPVRLSVTHWRRSVSLILSPSIPPCASEYLATGVRGGMFRVGILFRFVRRTARTDAPWGCIARAVSRTKSDWPPSG